MTLLVRKKNGALEDFDNSKLAKAAKSSFLNVGYSDDDAEAAGWRVASDVESQVRGRNEINREELHDLVQLSLMDINKHAAVAYIVYRNNQRNKHGQVDTLINALRSISKETSKENANIANSPPAKMLQIGEAANKHYVLNYILPKKLAKPHIDGDYHIHDLPWYTVTSIGAAA